MQHPQLTKILSISGRRVGVLPQNYLHSDPRHETSSTTSFSLLAADGDGHLFRLVSEAHRIRLAHLFDPVLAVHNTTALLVRYADLEWRREARPGMGLVKRGAMGLPIAPHP